MTIVAPDILIPAAGVLPSGWILSAIRALAIVETNGRGCTLSTSSGKLEVAPIDGYGDRYRTACGRDVRDVLIDDGGCDA